MRAPLSWLRDFAPIDRPTAELSDVLSNLGLVVEGVETIGSELTGIVVARVLDLRAHPNADKIQLVDVDTGDGQPLQICCGAFNMNKGDLVPLATLGTVMPNGLEIARRKMRGEWSNGMLCSAAELELPAQGDESGIFILPPEVAPLGTPVADALGLEADAVFDLDISPNRPDALSIAGVARDLAAALGVPFAYPAWGAATLGGPDGVYGSGGPRLPVPSAEVLSPESCPRLMATVVGNVVVGRSPAWIVRRLTMAGMRSINNVVDASNYVMLELGQPNHPYDLDRLAGGGLVVRGAAEGETITTLDGVTRNLAAGDCLICDGDSVPVGIAGIMGSASSETTESTTTVLLEAAYFNPPSIARTGKRLGLFTEARQRFERGVDPELADMATARFVSLLPDVRRGPAVDVRSELVPAPLALAVRTARVNQVLGTLVSDDQIAALLEPIGFEVSFPTEGVATVVVPTFRPDTTREIDVIEEVARHHGYENIAKTVPSALSSHRGLTEYQKQRRQVREILLGAGLSEAWTTTFLAPGDLERCGLGGGVEVQNPLDRSESVLRASLMPGLLKAVRFNADRQADTVALFEIGHVFAPPSGSAPVPDEHEELAIVVSGADVDATVAARLWAVLAGALRLEGVTLTASELPGLHPTRNLAISVAAGGRGGPTYNHQRPVGGLGEVDAEVSAGFGVAGRISYLGVDLERLLASPRRGVRMKPISRFPSSDLDLAFAVADQVPAAAVEEALRAAGGDPVESIVLFDVYRGGQLDQATRSLAYRIRLRAFDRTLTEIELGRIRQALIDAVAKVGGTLRT